MGSIIDEIRNNPELINAAATVTTALATVFLVVVTALLWIATQNMAEISQTQKQIQGFEADLTRPKPTCTWMHKNDSIRLMMSNTGQNAYLVGKIKINATFLPEGYYGYRNGSATFTTGSHPVIPGQSNREFTIEESSMQMPVKEEVTQVQAIGEIRDLDLNISAGKTQFTQSKYMGEIECHQVSGVFLNPIE